jgi:hypothetical protein
VNENYGESRTDFRTQTSNIVVTPLGGTTSAVMQGEYK